MSMRSLILIAGVIAAAATQVPAYLERFALRPQAEARAMATVPQKVETQSAASRGAATLASDSRGHYLGTFRMNGKSVDALVDTGASFVTLPESVARRLGFGAAALRFDYPVATANGSITGALVTLDRVEIGPVRVRNVAALVLKDDALSATLIGNTFLRQLSAYKVEGGQMRLVD
ncbi:TIGR02281 family clan AA aspartic protease [Rhizobiaceae bacterium BDR2-2]|uniref:TIGR02281 family clan AA aspartic protease n=1 Tax=Ectorhizobium quercum TaxID=2965071 RepID=A0AAE3ST84_9HYPH|nr:TIGR02281 family clan AA aspartic protease [Ectorhizobium quercum]MCX8995677.1 TIGR02281 family clan AA aspartic protease [Ectorhizobium quercum]